MPVYVLLLKLNSSAVHIALSLQHFTVGSRAYQTRWLSQREKTIAGLILIVGLILLMIVEELMVISNKAEFKILAV